MTEINEAGTSFKFFLQCPTSYFTNDVIAEGKFQVAIFQLSGYWYSEIITNPTFVDVLRSVGTFLVETDDFHHYFERYSLNHKVPGNTPGVGIIDVFMGS